jgi:two-component system nitrogen regulation sensor histidine kinase NtrY
MSFGASWLANTYWQLPGTNPLYPSAARLQKLVNQAATTAGREASQVAVECQPPVVPDFRLLLTQCSYPTFVAVEGQLVGWSASGPAPTETELGDTVSERLSQTPLGEFLVVRRAIGSVVVLAYVPLARHYGISNRYLREGAEPALLQGMEVQVRATPVQPNETHGLVAALVDTQGRYLFSVVQMPGNALTGRILPLMLLVLGIVSYTAGWLGVARRWWESGRVGAALTLLAVTPCALRLALLYVGLPYAWLEIPLFDPRVYAVSGWAPSLGDLLLNGLLAALLASLALLASRHYQLPSQAQRGRPWRWGLPALAGLLVTVVGLHSYYLSAFSNNQLSLDITQSMQVSGFRVVLVLTVLLHTAAFVAGFYLFSELLLPDLRRLPRQPLLLGGALLALVLVVLGVVLHHALLLPGMVGVCLVLMRSGRLDRRATQGGPRYLLLLLLLALASALGAVALYGQFERQLLLDKQRLASNLLVDNDLQGEFLLGQRLRQLAADPTIAQMLTTPPVRADALRRRIERQYLRNYFDKYEEAINLFDPSGQPLGGEADDTLTFNQTRVRLSRTATATDQAGVYLLKSDNSFSSRRYVAVVPITQPAPGGIGPPAPAGTILLTLSLKQLASYSVLPELLVDQKFFQPGLATDLSYAGYAKGRLVYSEGDFDYANRLPPSLLHDPRLSTTGLIISDFHHLALADASGRRMVVVTTSTYSLADWFSNFSFQLLLNVLVWLLAGGAYLLGRRGGLGLRLNFSARIQLLLNLGIIIPLLVVSIATASQVISGYRRDLHRTYERR